MKIEIAQAVSKSSILLIVNPTIEFILRSPLHGILNKKFLWIAFTARNSGKAFTAPVSCSQDGNALDIFSHAAWWKNQHPQIPTTLRLRGKDVQGLPEPMTEEKKAVVAGLMAHLRRSPNDAPFYGVTLDENKNPHSDKVEVGAQTIVMIRVALC